MKKFLLTACTGLMMTLWVNGQHTVSGHVRNADGAPLPGAAVLIDGRGAATNAAGQFVIDNVKSGTHNLNASFIGYEPYTAPVNVAGDVVHNVVLTSRSIVTGEVMISAIKAQKNDPVAYTGITREAIDKQNYGQDIPYLLSLTPGLVTTSDAGTGVGYTGLRLRGTDASRINIAVNGIPLNDAESQAVYWVNMPDFASSVDEMQVQRGVGTSTNGAASFGGSINLSTLGVSASPQVVTDNSYGSFNTLRNSVMVKTGLLNDKFAFDVRLSNMHSDGFVDRAFSDLKSFYLSGGYFSEATSLRFVTFSGKEHTYQAWNGVPKVKLNGDRAGMEKLVMMDGWSQAEAENLYSADARTFNRYLYANQTDNYEQNHYQLHLSHRIQSNMHINASLHYTHGEGYYESYKYYTKFSKYGLPFSSVVVDGKEVKRTDLVNQKWLDNDFYGAVFSWIYQTDHLHLVSGAAANRYLGRHFGDVVWMSVNNGTALPYEWYRNKGTKDDFNWYTKATLEVADGVSIYGDLQYRSVAYHMEGLHDDFTDLTLRKSFSFVNPKAGINYAFATGGRVFASVAVANREPSRNDFRDADIDKKPTAEKLTDYEAGIEWKSDRWAVQLNAYYMVYNDQLVLTGEVNNVGSAIMTNVPESFRRGIEVTAGIQPFNSLRVSGSVALSENKIKNFTSHVDNWSYWDDPDNQPFQFISELGTTDIAFSPSVTASGQAEWTPLKNLTASWMSKYVGEQFIDNTSNRQRMLDAYLVNDVVLNYHLPVKGWCAFDFGLQVNNILNEQYISNAWVYRYVSENVEDVLDGYFPQAGRHVMGRVRMSF
ncbi:MAG: TonB-dependent receptor [Marinilabiliaceae bacterium]|nr:TonB-dependent receptor [Marinilabiliaceae bacterium]